MYTTVDWRKTGHCGTSQTMFIIIVYIFTIYPVTILKSWLNNLYIIIIFIYLFIYLFFEVWVRNMFKNILAYILAHV